MRIAQRLEALKPSATLAVAARARELKSRGVDVLSFAAGEPDFSTPQPIVDACKRALDAGMTSYGPVPGDLACREALCEKLTRENGIPGLTPDDVVVSSGGKHSLYQLFQALLDPPCEGIADRVVLPTPAWVSYRPQIELAGGVVDEIPTTADTDYKITPDQLRDAITRETRAVVLNSPSNPCGTMYTPDELRALGAVIAEAASSVAPDLMLVSDELYEHILFDGNEHLSLGSLAGLAERTVTVNGLSKAYAMTGWRVGYFACPGERGARVVGAVKKLQSQSTTAIPTFIMPAIVAALTESAAHVEEMRAAFEQRARVAYDAIASIPGVACPKPMGAFYLFPDVSAHFGKTSAAGTGIESGLTFAGALLDEAHVAVVPGEGFGTGGERCFRFTFACGEEQIRAGAERIRGFVESLT
ncbi:MAG: pyridoxal phosphate-dependent aminotransferase [Planctomycetota bacterium]